ncbi:MAG TPA: DUF2914 domain-containing protein, partial [Candidatus Acidoferrum sp.]|nr:DUF2914 domain-containing protein [Candidatus Acidoferrum sp.]
AFAWLRRWGISLASLAGGLLTLFVFRRELPHAPWIVGYLLLLWLLIASSVQLRDGFRATRTGRFALGAADYTIQTLYHGVLLFLLPAYWASTTVDSPNVAFLIALAILVLLATFDPWYRALAERTTVITDVFFFVSAFAALNVALPLVGVPPFWAMLLAAWTAVVGLAPALRRSRHWPWRRALKAGALGGLVVAGLVFVARVGIPPAPLFVARSALARDVSAGEPVDELGTSLSADDLRGIVAFTAVYAPAGLHQPISHVWRREGQVVSVVKLSPIHGGRRDGFRTFSRKSVVPAEAEGRWSVDVITDSGQLIGRLRFRVDS